VYVCAHACLFINLFSHVLIYHDILNNNINNNDDDDDDDDNNRLSKSSWKIVQGGTSVAPDVKGVVVTSYHQKEDTHSQHQRESI
jgi:hypothetical protein